MYNEKDNCDTGKSCDWKSDGSPTKCKLPRPQLESKV